MLAQTEREREMLAECERERERECDIFGRERNVGRKIAISFQGSYTFMSEETTNTRKATLTPISSISVQLYYY